MLAWSIFTSLYFATKVLAGVFSLSWMAVHGSDYYTAINRASRSMTTSHDYWSALDEAHARVFPFGIRAYRLRRTATRLEETGAFLARISALALRAVDVGINSLVVVPICSFSLTAAAALGATGATRGVFVGVALALLVYPLLIIVEAVFSYARVGSYGAAVYRPSRLLSNSGGSQLVDELQALAYIALLALLSDSAATLYLGSSFGSFGDIDGLPVEGIYGILSGLGDSFYYSFLTFCTAGDAEPRNGLGKLVTALVTAQGVSLLVIALASFGALSRLVPPTPRSEPVVGPAVRRAFSTRPKP